LSGTSDFTFRWQGYIVGAGSVAGNYLVLNDGSFSSSGSPLSNLTFGDLQNMTTYVFDNFNEYEIYQMYASTFSSNTASSPTITVTPVLVSCVGGVLTSTPLATTITGLDTNSEFTLTTTPTSAILPTTNGYRIGVVLTLSGGVSANVFVSIAIDIRQTNLLVPLSATSMDPIQSLLTSGVVGDNLDVNDILEIIKNM
jgi:hypothetical protein